MRIENLESLIGVVASRLIAARATLAFGRGHGLAEDATELIAFVQQFVNSLPWKQFSDDDEAEPPAGFDKFLERNVQFMSEVGFAFGGASLVVVGRGGRAATHKLSRDVPPEPRVRQRIDDLADARREALKPL